jgi:hypothetical protein
MQRFLISTEGHDLLRRIPLVIPQQSSETIRNVCLAPPAGAKSTKSVVAHTGSGIRK